MDIRDIIAEEMGYVICPISSYTYVHCDEKCEKCPEYKDFIKGIEETYNG